MMKRIAQALIAGIRDGWDQPYEIGWSTNVEHLISSESDEDSTLTWQDVARVLRAVEQGLGDVEGDEGLQDLAVAKARDKVEHRLALADEF